MRLAIIADTHVNPHDDASSSVYAVHANANGRSRSVVQKINALNVDLVVHLGDTVHRIQGQPQRGEAVARFHEIMKGLDSPLIQVPGNHDEGEKSTPWAPGHSVTPDTLAHYRNEFGADHFYRDVAGFRFIVLNSQLYGLGGDAELQQREMLTKALSGGQTKFVFQHHPFFLESMEEQEHYDNLSPEIRRDYVSLIVNAGVKAVFAGHVHNFFYNKIGMTDFFVVPSTTFVRHDFTELFPFVPQDGAHGRNYSSKLGFFVIECDAPFSSVRWFRTNGHEDPSTAHEKITASPVSLFAGDRAHLGVDLRHDWATLRAIPYTQLQDEFNRKHIRNDYFTSAIAEMAICRLRVPIQDLEEEKPRSRLKELADLGIKAMVFLYRCPSPRQADILKKYSDLIDFVECCAPIEEIDEIARLISGAGLTPHLKIAFSAMGTSTGGEEAMAHYIWTGFDLSNAGVDEYIADVSKHKFEAVVVRIERHKFDIQQILDFAAHVSRIGLHGIVYARLASIDAAATMDVDEDNAGLVASLTILARLLQPHISIYLDTLADHDRGYYPRTGLTDRAYDLRPAGRVVASLTRLLDGEHLDITDPSPERIFFESANARYCFIPRPALDVIADHAATVSSDRGFGQAEVFALDQSSSDGTNLSGVRFDVYSEAPRSPVLLRSVFEDVAKNT